MELDLALARLSEGTRLVDSGAAPFGAIHPVALMSIIRARFREGGDAEALLSGYLRDPDEPVAARVIAVLSLSHLWTESAVRLHGSLLVSPPDPKVAGAVIYGYHMCSFSGEPDFGDALEHLVPVGLSERYSYCNHVVSGHCGDAEVPAGADVNLMLDGLLAFLERSNAGTSRMPALYVANVFCNRKESSDSQRAKLRTHAEAAYLKGEPGWHIVLNSLEFGSRVWSREQLVQLLGRGLANLGDRELLQVLDRVYSRDREALLRPPFSDQFKRVAEILDRDPGKGGVPVNAYGNLRFILKE